MPSPATGLVKSVDIGEADLTVGVAGSSSGRFSGSPIASVRTGPTAAPAASPAGWDVSTAQGRGSARVRFISVPQILVSPASAATDVGQTVTFTATAVDWRGIQRWGNISPTWTSQKTSVATVDPKTGVATGVSNGTTTITAWASVRSKQNLGTYSGKASLRVTVCGGIAAVKSWDATISVAYTPPDFNFNAGLSVLHINQSSSATATLQAASSPIPGNIGFWTTPGTTPQSIRGTGSVHNTETGPAGTQSEDATAAPFKGALMELMVASSAAGCQYQAYYEDGIDIQMTTNGSSTTLTAVLGATSVQAVPLPPATGGQWVLTGSLSLPAVFVAPTPSTSNYIPGTPLSTLIVEANNGTYGAAQVHYTFTSH